MGAGEGITAVTGFELWPLERWLPVVGYEGLYDVSDMGRVRSLPRMGTAGKILSPGDVGRPGHPRLSVVLHCNGKRHARGVHCLVLEAFVGPCPPGLEGCHYNDIGDDNRLSNLRWDTHSANIFDKVRNGHDYNSRKDRCINGHAFTPENTMYSKQSNGWNDRRSCRKCKRAAWRRWKAKTA
jgi:hypothetical protein